MEFGNLEKRILDEIKKSFPTIDEQNIYWKQLKTLKHYVVIVVTQTLGDIYVPPVYLALGTFKSLYLTKVEDMLTLLKEEELSIEEQNYAKIVELFELIYPKQILKNARDLEQPGIIMKANKENKIEMYTDLITPPRFYIKDSAKVITFWTIDFQTGDLEQWNIYEDNDGEMRIEDQVLEANLIEVLLKK